MYAQLAKSRNIFHLVESSNGTYSEPDDPEAARRGSVVNRSGLHGSGGTAKLDFGKEYNFEDENGVWREIPPEEALEHRMG